MKISSFPENSTMLALFHNSVVSVLASPPSFQRPMRWGCTGSGDYVELLGGNGVDTSKMYPMADLCFSPSGLSESTNHPFNTPYQVISVQHQTLPCCTTLYCYTALHCNALHYTGLLAHSAVLYCTVLYYTILNYKSYKKM